MYPEYDCYYCGGDTLGEYRAQRVCTKCVGKENNFVSDYSRDATIAKLAEAHAAGYIDMTEHDKRVDAVMKPNLTQRQLKSATSGLPKYTIVGADWMKTAEIQEFHGPFIPEGVYVGLVFTLIALVVTLVIIL